MIPRLSSFGIVFCLLVGCVRFIKSSTAKQWLLVQREVLHEAVKSPVFPGPPELPPPVVNLDCTTNFMIVNTAPETTSCWFPDPPALLNNFIPSDIALLISCSLDPPLEDPPDVNCLMTYKNPQRVWSRHRGKKGWTRLQGSSTADRLGAHSLNIS